MNWQEMQSCFIAVNQQFFLVIPVLSGRKRFCDEQLISSYIFALPLYLYKLSVFSFHFPVWILRERFEAVRQSAVAQLNKNPHSLS